MCRGSLHQDVETCQAGQIGRDKGASIYLRSPAQRVSVRALSLAQKCLEERIRRLPVSQLFEVRPAGFFFNPYPYLKKAGAGECLASATSAGSMMKDCIHRTKASKPPLPKFVKGGWDTKG